MQRIIHNEKFCKPRELTEEEIKKSKIGLGDAVAKIAQPIAKTIDSIAGTNIQHCNACKKRQEKLNNLIPNIGIDKKE